MRVLCAFRIEQCCKEGGADDFRVRYCVRRGDVGAVHHACPFGRHRPCSGCGGAVVFEARIDDAGAHQHVHVHPPCGYHGGACRVGHASWKPGQCAVRVFAFRLQPSFERSRQRGGIVGVQRPVLAVLVFGQAFCMAATAAAGDDRGNGHRVRGDGVPCIFRRHHRHLELAYGSNLVVAECPGGRAFAGGDYVVCRPMACACGAFRPAADDSALHCACGEYGCVYRAGHAIRRRCEFGGRGGRSCAALPHDAAGVRVDVLCRLRACRLHDAYCVEGSGGARRGRACALQARLFACLSRACWCSPASSSCVSRSI